MQYLNLVLILVGALVVYYLYTIFMAPAPVQNEGSVEMMQKMNDSGSLGHKVTCHGQVQSLNDADDCYETIKNNENILPFPQQSNTFAVENASIDCFPKDQLTANDLLPKDTTGNMWNVVNPASVSGSLTDQNFLQSGYHFGINTVGNSLRVANTQLRSDPIIPRVATGPWLQSTVEADTNRKCFEIGDSVCGC